MLKPEEKTKKDLETKLKQEEAIFLSVNGVIYHSNELLKTIYDKNKDLDRDSKLNEILN